LNILPEIIFIASLSRQIENQFTVHCIVILRWIFLGVHYSLPIK
jgi:hypothetical protein